MPGVTGEIAEIGLSKVIHYLIGVLITFKMTQWLSKRDDERAKYSLLKATV